MNKELDWPRIAHLMKIGIDAALMVLAGDMLLGWGMHDAAKQGLEGFLSAYLNLSDGRIFWSSLLGLIGIPLEALCYFAVYRLIAPYSSRLAHLYRSGIIGVLAFGGCGVHVPCLACVFFYSLFTYKFQMTNAYWQFHRKLPICILSAYMLSPIIAQKLIQHTIFQQYWSFRY